MQHDFILLDRSGSMGKLWAEAMSAVNGYVRKLASDNVDTGVTVAVFDEYQDKFCFDVIRDRITPPTFAPLTARDAEPRGWTPLSDAVGQIVNLAKAGNYDRVAIIIMTDGEENRSKELSVTQARLLLDQCRARGWQVIFLGANFDNARQAAAYGSAANTQAFVAQGNLRASSDSLASKRFNYGATGQAINFTDEEKTNLATPKDNTP